MVGKVFLFVSLIVSRLFDCYCLITYELDVKGEAQNGYYVNFNIGSPPQSVNLLIDTGSSNLAVAAAPPFEVKNLVLESHIFDSNNKVIHGKSSYRNLFHFQNSYTLQKLDSLIELHYVQGYWSGFLATDLITLDASRNQSVRSVLACMTTIHNVFDSNSKFIGLLGLAYPSAARPDSSVIPFFDALRRKESMENIFSINLCGPYFSSDKLVTSCGKIHLGYISHKHYTGEIVFTPIIKERLYEITLTNLKVDTKHMTVDCQDLNKPKSIIDTGSTYLMLPESLYLKTVAEIKKHVSEKIQLKMATKRNNFWLNDTNACFPRRYFDVSLFPEISLSFYHSENSSFDLLISPELYLVPWEESSVTNICFVLGVGLSDIGTVIGSTLLKGFYLIFDRSNKQIGFANSSSFQGDLELKNFVTSPYFLSNMNFSSCKYADNSTENEANITAGMIILLLVVLFLAILLLYRIILWIREYMLEHSDNRSDTSSLVGEY